MADQTFSEIGKMEAIASLYEGSGFQASDDCRLEAPGREYVSSFSKLYLEGVDFDLVYFPLKHLGYKVVTGVVGEMYAQMCHPKALAVNLAVSAKLDYAQIKELWDGMVVAAKDYGFQKLSLDLQPSRNGLAISLSAMGETALITGKRRPKAHSKDLICISGCLGAAYLGLQVLEQQKSRFIAGEGVKLDNYKMMVGAYLKPELDPQTVVNLEDNEIYPSFGYFVTSGLSDAVKRLSRDSGLGAKVYADKIPFEGNSFQLGKEMDIDPISAAMNGGDDYRLLFTIPILSLEKFRRDFQTFSIIGHLALPEAGTVLVTPDGVELPLKAPGWND